MRTYQTNGANNRVMSKEHLARVIYSQAYRCLSAEDSRKIVEEVNINSPHKVDVITNPLHFMERLLLHNTTDITTTGKTLLGELSYGQANMNGIIKEARFNTSKRAACIITRDSKEFGRLAEDIVIYCPNNLR